MRLIGHKKQIKYFEKLIKEDAFLNAYIFSGLEGVGKLEALKYILLKYVCEKKEGCGECTRCKRLKKLSIPDINFILPDRISENLNKMYEEGEWSFENLRTDKFSRELVIGIKTVRRIEEEIKFKPLELERKFYIFLDADLLNREAQNALLKILEEPPDFVSFFLITPFPDSLHLTITSRCIQIPFFSLNFEEFKKYFGKRKSLYFLYRFSGGSIGRAKKIIDENLIEEYGNFLKEIARNENEEYFPFKKFEKSEIKNKIFLFGFFLEELTKIKLDKKEIFRDHPYVAEIEFLSSRIDPYTLDFLYEKYYKILEGFKRNIPAYFLGYLFDSLRFGLP